MYVYGHIKLILTYNISMYVSLFMKLIDYGILFGYLKQIKNKCYV